MRATQRVLTAGLTAAGLVTAVGVVAAPAVSAAPEASRKATMEVSVSGSPRIGGKCEVTFALSADDGYVAAPVVLQKRTGKSEPWQAVRRYRTSADGPRTVRVRAWQSISYRVVHEGSAKASKAASFARCTVSALKQGDSGKAVRLLQKRLRRLNVRPAEKNGRYGYDTYQAVMAFQKHRRLPRTGVADERTWRLISEAERYKGPAWCKKTDRICIDISKQVAYLRTPESKQPFLIPVSSGNERWFTKPSGGRDFANTPRGRYKVWLKRPGRTDGDLGTYYWFSAFHRGWGVHGSNSVPSYPASHGCVRVPRSIERWVYRNLPMGAYVVVHD